MARENENKDNDDENRDTGAGGFLKSLKKTFDGVANTGNLAKGASVSPFMSAVKKGEIEKVKNMLDKGMDPNVYNMGGLTALHLTISKNNAEMAQLLIDRGADVNRPAKTASATTPLDSAIAYNKPDMVSVLTRNGAQLTIEDDSGWTALHRAVEQGRVEIVQALLDAGADGEIATQNGSTPLLLAVSRNQAGTLKALLSNKSVAATVNRFVFPEDGSSALHMAISREYPDVVQELITAGANVNFPDERGWRPVHIAAQQGRPEIISALVKAGADLNKSLTRKNSTALHIAAANDKPSAGKIVEALLHAGADPDVVNTDGATAMTVAAERGRAEVVETLLRYGGDPNRADTQGVTPLLKAIAAENMDAVKALLRDERTDVNAVHMKTGSTPLHEAVKLQNPGLVKALLQRGASPAALDTKDASPLLLARRGGEDVLVSMLEDALLKSRRARLARTKPSSGP